jgi:hypothetical protein
VRRRGRGAGLIPERSDDADGWQKSSWSHGSDDCVEVRIGESYIHVRHSMDPSGPVLTFSRAEWSAFLHGVHHGEFELSESTP